MTVGDVKHEKEASAPGPSRKTKQPVLTVDLPYYFGEFGLTIKNGVWGPA